MIDDHGGTAFFQTRPDEGRSPYPQVFEEVSSKKKTAMRLGLSRCQLPRDPVRSSPPAGRRLGASPIASTPGKVAGAASQPPPDPPPTITFVSILPQVRDAIGDKSKDRVVELLFIVVGTPVNSQDVPVRDLGHLDEDAQDRILVRIPTTRSVKIEKDRLGTPRSLLLDSRPFPFRPGERATLTASRVAQHQQADESKRYPKKEPHLLAPRLRLDT